MHFNIEIIDAFTETRFSGNSAAVCFVPSSTEISDTTMALIAREMNLSETAFVTPLPGNTSDAPVMHLRWFSPTVEVALCGHATLATAHAIFQCMSGEFCVTGKAITFKTKSGDLFVAQNEKGLRMDFPQGAPQNVSLAAGTLDALTAALGVFQRKCVLDTAFCARTKKLVVSVASSADVLACHPDFRQLHKVDFGEIDVRGVIVTSNVLAGTEFEGRYDFVSRYFTPWNGIDEDPVTGSAHTVLGVYWQNKLGRNVFRARQASARGGDLQVTVGTDGRVILEGQAVTVLRGTITV